MMEDAAVAVSLKGFVCARKPFFLQINDKVLKEQTEARCIFISTGWCPLADTCAFLQLC